MHVTSRCQGLFPPHPFKGKALGTRLTKFNAVLITNSIFAANTTTGYIKKTSNSVELNVTHIWWKKHSFRKRNKVIKSVHHMTSSPRDHHTAHLSSPRFISLLLEQLKAFENLSKLDSDPITLQKDQGSRWSTCQIVRSYKHWPHPPSPAFDIRKAG